MLLNFIDLSKDKSSKKQNKLQTNYKLHNMQQKEGGALETPAADSAQAQAQRRNSAAGLKLSLAHIQKYNLDEDLLSVANYTADELPKPRKRRGKKEKKDKEYYKEKYPGYDSDDIDFLEADFGGDDSDPKFNYSMTGSDIQMNPISEDGDQKDKMRHLEILKEQEQAQRQREAALKKKLEEEAAKKTYKTVKIQTDRVAEYEQSDSSEEYVAPPTPTEKISEEDSKEFEYDAASDFVEKHIQMGAKKETEDAAIGDDRPMIREQASSEDLEYQAPPDSDDFMGMTEKEYVKYQQAQQQLSWFEKQEAMKNFKDVVVQAEVVDLGRQAEQDEKDLKKDVKMKTKALQADLDASLDLMKNSLAANLKERVALMKKQNIRESGIQTNLEGESLDQAAREKEEQLERQRRLREKKQKLKEALDNEQRLKEEKEYERRAQSKLNKKNLMQNKKKIREFQEQLREQNESQIKQTHEVNEKIQEMHEQYKQEAQDVEMEEELNLQLAQQEVDELAREAYKQLEAEWKSTDSEDAQKYDEDGNPIINRKDKRPHRGKLNYDMNVQTEGNIDDALFEHPLDLIQQNASQYSPQPFKEMKSSMGEYEERNQSSRLSLIPTGKMPAQLPAQRASIHSIDKVKMSPTRLHLSPKPAHEIDPKITIGSQKGHKSPTRSPYSKALRQSALDREHPRKSPEQLDLSRRSSPRKYSHAPTYQEQQKIAPSYLDSKIREREDYDVKSSNKYLPDKPSYQPLSRSRQSHHAPYAAPAPHQSVHHQSPLQRHSPHHRQSPLKQYQSSSKHQSPLKRNEQQAYQPIQPYQSVQTGRTSQARESHQPLLPQSQINYQPQGSSRNLIPELQRRSDPQPTSSQGGALQQIRHSAAVNRQEFPSHQIESRETSIHQGRSLEIPQQIHSRKQSNPFLGASPDLTNDIDDLSYQRARQNPAIAEYMKQASPHMKRGSIGPSTSGVNFQDDGFADQIGFGDSVSQRVPDHSDVQQQDGPLLHPSAADMKGKPFASNLENAKILAQVTKRRIENMDLGPDHFNPTGDSNKELEKQKKANNYLNETLKHLNMSVDILINQYDPIKMKSLRQATDKYSQLLEEDRLQKEEEVALGHKLSEIRNAEKQMKTAAKELQSLQKKYDRVKDWKHLSNLYKQTDEDQRKIQRLEKDNKKLRVDQRKAEFKIAKQMKNVPESILQEDLNYSELLELDNEYKMLRHKADYLQEKLFKEQEAEREQQRLLNELKQKVKYAEQEEQKISEAGRRLYKIDFDDVATLDGVNQQDQLSQQKDKILKKMVILEDGKASIDKQYAQQHRKNMQKMQHLNELKKQMEDSLKYNEDAYLEKRQQLKFYQQQKKANDTLKKQRMTVQRDSQVALSEPSRLGQFDPNLLAKASTPAQSQLDPQINKPLQVQQPSEKSQQNQMNAAAVLSQPPSSTKEHPLPTSSYDNLKLSTFGTEEGDRSQRAAKNPDPGLKKERVPAQKVIENQKKAQSQRQQIKSRAGSQRSSKTNANKDSGVNQSQTNSKMENQRGFNEVPAPAQEVEVQRKSPERGLTKARLEAFDNKQKLAQAIAEQRQQTKSLAIEREEKEQKERQKSQGSQRSPRSPVLSKQPQKKETETAKASQLALKNQKVSAPKMNIEDIAIIRETLAEDDLEELTALDLEKQNFKSTISGTGAAKSGVSKDAKNNKNSLIKLIDNMPTLNQIDEVRPAGPDVKKTKSKTNESRGSQQKQVQRAAPVGQAPGGKATQGKEPQSSQTQAKAGAQKRQDPAPVSRAAAGKPGEQRSGKGRPSVQSKAAGSQRGGPAQTSEKKTAIHVDMQTSLSRPRLEEEARSSADGGQQDLETGPLATEDGDNSAANADPPRGETMGEDALPRGLIQETNSLQTHNVGDILMIDNGDEQNSPRTQVGRDLTHRLVERSRVKSPKSQAPKKDPRLQ